MKSRQIVRAAVVILALPCLLLLPGYSNVTSGQDKKDDPPKRPSPPTPIIHQLAGGDYHLWHYEFKDAATCKKAYEALQNQFPDDAMPFPPYKQFLDVLLRFTKKQTPDGKLTYDFGNYAKAKKTLDDFDGPWADQDSYVAVPPRPNPPKATEPSRATKPDNDVVAGGYKGLTGDGIIIVIIDTALDYRNPAFQTADGKSRLLYYWDLNAQGKSVWFVEDVLTEKDPKIVDNKPTKKFPVKLHAGHEYVIDLKNRVPDDQYWDKYDPILAVLDEHDKIVLDQKGQPLYNDDLFRGDKNTPPDKNSQIAFKPSVDGTFYLAASRYQGAGAFLLNVTDKSWSPNKDVDFLFPNGAPFGIMYTQEEINRSLKGSGPYINGDYWDAKTEGHGTSCASVAAGNDNNKKAAVKQGAAPKADLIVVAAGDPITGGIKGSMMHEICKHVQVLAKKANKPVVFSCSFGFDASQKPYPQVNDRQLDEQFSPDKPGHVICIAAGNDGKTSQHAGAILDGKGTKQKITWTAIGNPRLALLCNTEDKESIQLEGPYGKRLTDALIYDPRIKSLCIDPKLYNDSTKAIHVGDKQGPEIEYLTVSSSGGKEVVLNLYLDNLGGQFLEPFASSAMSIGSPGLIANAVTVGSYDWNDMFKGKPLAVWDNIVTTSIYHNMIPGQLSSYSSQGPLKGYFKAGFSKPDIVSPGQYFTVHLPQQYLKQSPKDTVNFFNGTSAATPYTAGVVALMMEARRRNIQAGNAKADLTTTEIRALFNRHVTPRSQKDQFVKDSVDKFGPLPNGAWGYGRLDAAAVQAILDDLLTEKRK
jgi:hypothetical protein